MRKILISFLLTSAAASPAIAGPRDFSDRQDARAQRVEMRNEARFERQADRPDRYQAPPMNRQTFTGMQRPERFDPSQQAPQPSADMVRNWRMQERQNAGGSALADPRGAAMRERFDPRQQRFDPRQQRFDPRQQQVYERQQRIEQNEQRFGQRPPIVQRNRMPVVSTVPRPGTQPPLRVESRPRVSPNWRNNWRHDDRYDWRDWRRRHYSIFHIGVYFDPFGWGYQPYSIGWRLWPAYYSPNFWLNDPWMYRLPYAPPGTRWIRYYNDALLVDTWTGEVVDAIPNFFW